MTTDISPATSGEAPKLSRTPVDALAAYVRGAGTGEHAALARLDPDRLRPHEIAAISRAFLAAGFDPAAWRPETWRRWAMIASGMALTDHDGSARLGEQLARAGVAESRVTRLLTARGAAFEQQVPRLLRLMTSKGVRLNWHELAALILADAHKGEGDAASAERLRLRIAGPYFAARSASDIASA